jgi:hypothetical protein
MEHLLTRVAAGPLIPNGNSVANGFGGNPQVKKLLATRKQFELTKVYRIDLQRITGEW